MEKLIKRKISNDNICSGENFTWLDSHSGGRNHTMQKVSGGKANMEKLDIELRLPGKITRL